MELFTKLGLKEICYIVNQLGLSTNMEFLHGSNIVVNGRTYNYEKRGNSVFITDSVGNCVKVAVKYTEEPTKDHYGRDVIYVKHEISADYALPNGELINIYNNISLDRGYEAFENVQRHDLMHGLRLSHINDNQECDATFSLGLDRVCLQENNQIYEFNENGIVAGRRILSEDGSSLVSVSGVDAPAKELIYSFDMDEEQKKLDRIIEENTDLHPFTKEVLEETKRLLVRRGRYIADYRNYYDFDINEARKAMNIRNRLIGEFNKEMMDPEGLEAVARDIYQRRLETQKLLSRRR